MFDTLPSLLSAGLAFWPLRCHKMCLSLRHRLRQVQVLPDLLFSEELLIVSPVGVGRLQLGIMVAAVFQTNPSTNCGKRFSNFPSAPGNWS